MGFSLIRLVAIVVVVVLVVKKLFHKKSKNKTEEVEYESISEPKREHKVRSQVTKAIKDKSFTIKPQFKMCGNCLYWQGERERVKYSQDVKIIDDREMAKCSNKDAYHKSPIDKRRANAGACKFYERW